MAGGWDTGRVGITGCNVGVVSWRARCDDVRGLNLALGVGTEDDVALHGNFEIEGREASSRVISGAALPSGSVTNLTLNWTLTLQTTTTS